MANIHCRSCIDTLDKFCFVYGQFIVKSQIRSLTKTVQKAYVLYFGCQVGDQDKSWASHVWCVTCYVSLIEWLKGEKKLCHSVFL
jgi:hypothetical protein